MPKLRSRRPTKRHLAPGTEKHDRKARRRNCVNISFTEMGMMTDDSELGSQLRTSKYSRAVVPSSRLRCTMATAAIPPADLESFAAHLQSSKRILALLGAGLSASSGLPTFRGAGGLWRNHKATRLATPEAFAADPALVWQFYSYRRHMALQAKPNKAHYALAELAKKKEGFVTLSQNVDGT